MISNQRHVDKNFLIGLLRISYAAINVMSRMNHDDSLLRATPFESFSLADIVMECNIVTDQRIIKKKN